MSAICVPGAASSGNLIHPLAAMTGMREIWRADYGITKDGSNLVSEWRGMLQAYLFVGSGATKPTWVSSSAGLNSKPSVNLTDATKFVATDLAKSSYNWRHNGTLGVTEVVVLYSASVGTFQYLLGTMGTTNGPGFTLSAFATTPFAFTGYGSGFSQALANGSNTGSGKRWLAGTGSQGATVTTRCRTDKSSSWTSAGPITPSAADSHTDFRLSSGGAVALEVAEIIQLTGVISDPNFATLTAYLVSQYGAF